MTIKYLRTTIAANWNVNIICKCISNKPVIKEDANDTWIIYHILLNHTYISQRRKISPSVTTYWHIRYSFVSKVLQLTTNSLSVKVGWWVNHCEFDTRDLIQHKYVITIGNSIMGFTRLVRQRFYTESGPCFCSNIRQYRKISQSVGTH